MWHPLPDMRKHRVHAMACRSCWRKLNWFRRKHLCRMCGLVHCSQCLKEHVVVPANQTSSSERMTVPCCVRCLHLVQMMVNQGDHRVLSHPGLQEPERTSPPVLDIHAMALLLKKIETFRPTSSTRRYLIESTWFRNWLDQVQYAMERSTSLHVDCGPIPNFRLVEVTVGLLRGKRSLQPHDEISYKEDYWIVDEYLWNTLLDFYGGGPSIYVESGETPHDTTLWQIAVQRPPPLSKEIRPPSLHNVSRLERQTSFGPTSLFSFDSPLSKTTEVQTLTAVNDYLDAVRGRRRALTQIQHL